MVVVVVVVQERRWDKMEVPTKRLIAFIKWLLHIPGKVL